MKIEDKYAVWYIHFDNTDFNTGLAEDAIKYFKNLPKGSKRYYDKKWIIYKNKVSDEFMTDLLDIKYKNKPTSKSFESEDDFDITHYLDETFGEK